MKQRASSVLRKVRVSIKVAKGRFVWRSQSIWAFKVCRHLVPLGQVVVYSFPFNKEFLSVPVLSTRFILNIFEFTDMFYPFLSRLRLIRRFRCFKKLTPYMGETSCMKLYRACLSSPSHSLHNLRSANSLSTH